MFRLIQGLGIPMSKYEIEQREARKAQAPNAHLEAPNLDDVVSHRELIPDSVADIETTPDRMVRTLKDLGNKSLARVYPDFYHQCYKGNGPGFWDERNGNVVDCEGIQKELAEFNQRVNYRK